mgnify:CR=1 FL=1
MTHGLLFDCSKDNFSYTEIKTLPKRIHVVMFPPKGPTHTLLDRSVCFALARVTTDSWRLLPTHERMLPQYLRDHVRSPKSYILRLIVIYAWKLWLENLLREQIEVCMGGRFFVPWCGWRQTLKTFEKRVKTKRTSIHVVLVAISPFPLSPLPSLSFSPLFF